MKSLSVNSVEFPSSTPAVEKPEGSGAAGFGQELEAAVKKVDDLQVAADVETQKLANGDGNLHETMLAGDEGQDEAGRGLQRRDAHDGVKPWRACSNSFGNFLRGCRRCPPACESR
jgi:hypothetical protein